MIYERTKAEVRWWLWWKKKIWWYGIPLLHTVWIPAVLPGCPTGLRLKKSKWRLSICRVHFGCCLLLPVGDKATADADTTVSTSLAPTEFYVTQRCVPPCVIFRCGCTVCPVKAAGCMHMDIKKTLYPKQTFFFWSWQENTVKCFTWKPKVIESWFLGHSSKNKAKKLHCHSCILTNGEWTSKGSMDQFSLDKNSKVQIFIPGLSKQAIYIPLICKTRVEISWEQPFF